MAFVLDNIDSFTNSQGSMNDLSYWNDTLGFEVTDIVSRNRGIGGLPTTVVSNATYRGLGETPGNPTLLVAVGVAGALLWWNSKKRR